MSVSRSKSCSRQLKEDEEKYTAMDEQNTQPVDEVALIRMMRLNCRQILEGMKRQNIGRTTGTNRNQADADAAPALQGIGIEETAAVQRNARNQPLYKVRSNTS